MRPRKLSEITDGTSQADRLAPALGDHCFDVDERTFEDIVASAADFSKAIPFYNVWNRPDGTWANLFAHNEAVVMAEIISTDSARMENEFLPLLNDHRQAARYLLRFGRRIDGWYQRLLDREQDGAHVVSRQIRVVIDRKLRTALHQALPFLLEEGASITKSPTRNALAQFHPVWALTRDEELKLATPDAPPDGTLRSSFYSLISAVAYLKPLATERLTQSLKSGANDPAVALFIAFVHLLGKTREKINQFTGKHRDFYYRDVLRMVAKPQIPDSTFLVLEPAPGVQSLLVPAGTEFSAGKAGGSTELLYATDSDLQVTDARVQSLLTFHCPRDPQISPEIELDYVDGLRSADAMAETTRHVMGAMVLSWPIFGANSPGTAMNLGQDAAAGFAMASSAFRLREGDRQIEVTVSFRLPKGDPGDSALSLGERFRHLIFEYPRVTKDQAMAFRAEAMRCKFTEQDLVCWDPEQIFQKVVGSAFNVDATVANGWYAINVMTVSVPPDLPPDRCAITFSITVGADAPSLSSYASAIHGAGYETQFPILRFSLNPRAPIFSYSLFRDLIVEEISIESHVSQARGVVAWNQFGQLDTSKPFTPFGPLPTTNSYLILGNFDAARMNLKELEIDIEWGNLPFAPEGLGEYYQDYGIGYENEDFVGRLSVLRDGRWVPLPEDASVVTRLFENVRDRPNIAPGRTLRMDVLRWFKRVDATLTEQQFQYDQKARNGFFRIDLAGPETAFGHTEYPALLTKILSENARTKREVRPLPPPPYTPVISRVSFRYSSHAIIGPSSADASGPFAERAFLLHPFGVQTAATREPWAWIPSFEDDGNLYIGLSASDPKGILTLLFHVREDSTSTLATAPEPVHWAYLSSDTWKVLEDNRVISDTTDGFLASGIVTLDIPPDIDASNTIMPTGLFWLRVSAPRNFASFCSLYSVRAQCVSATRRLTERAPLVLSEPLPARSIKNPLNSIPGLRSVLQPIRSADGREAETPRQQITRTAERLRHKMRAVTPWDYERLVLDNFPDIFKVKCFPAMTSEGEIEPRPGSVLVVVVPHQTRHHDKPVFNPMLDAIKLKRIRDFLLDVCTPHLRIEVRNPTYERILVRCAVRLTSGALRNRGYWLGQLNQAIIDFISPWSDVGPTPRFGWIFQNDEVEAFIRGLAYVEFVTQFSMLHLTRNDKGLYRLDDTANWEVADNAFGPEGANRPIGVNKISARYPWSLAIPNPMHIIETYPDVLTSDVEGIPTGIGKLEIGNTFVIGGLPTVLEKNEA